jgi:hypothetical protein
MESEQKCLILLTRDRGRDLVMWELKNQAAYANVPLLSMSSLSGTGTFLTNDSTVTCEANKKLNEVLFRAVFSCPKGCEPILKSVLSNCILLRSAYDQELCSAAGMDKLLSDLFEMGLSSSVSCEPLLCLLIYDVAIEEHVILSIESFHLHQSSSIDSSLLSLRKYISCLINDVSKYADANFIGRNRRVKGEKFVEQAFSKLSAKSKISTLSPESKKRKRNRNEDEDTENESKTNDQKDEGSCELIASSEVRSNMVDDGVNRGTVKNLHLLCDLRGFTNSEEKTAISYAAAWYCRGGDGACQQFSKIYAKQYKNFSLSRAMDFERCGLNYCFTVFEQLYY